jgi:hypothetical protein
LERASSSGRRIALLTLKLSCRVASSQHSASKVKPCTPMLVKTVVTMMPPNRASRSPLAPEQRSADGQRHEVAQADGGPKEPRCAVSGGDEGGRLRSPVWILLGQAGLESGECRRNLENETRQRPVWSVVLIVKCASGYREMTGSSCEI